MRTYLPNEGGYYWAKEYGDEEDSDILLVFVELDGTVWYGKSEFEPTDFLWWEKFTDVYKKENII